MNNQNKSFTKKELIMLLSGIRLSFDYSSTIRGGVGSETLSKIKDFEDIWSDTLQNTPLEVAFSEIDGLFTKLVDLYNMLDTLEGESDLLKLPPTKYLQ